jgi:hypothetical protein
MQERYNVKLYLNIVGSLNPYFIINIFMRVSPYTLRPICECFNDITFLYGYVMYFLSLDYYLTVPYSTFVTKEV